MIIFLLNSKKVPTYHCVILYIHSNVTFLYSAVVQDGADDWAGNVRAAVPGQVRQVVYGSSLSRAQSLCSKFWRLLRSCRTRGDGENTGEQFF